MARRVPILLRLLGATLVPAVLTFAGFGLLAHVVAGRALEVELSRRLVAAAQAAALSIRGERLDLLVAGDESSRAWRNAHRKLVELRDTLGVARIYAFDAGHASLADSDEATPIGARYYTLDGNAAEARRAFAGESVSSVLFTGRDGARYKSGYAPLRDEGGRVVAAVGVDGAAALYEQLASLRRTLFVAGGLGALAVVLLSVLVARRITRPVRELERAARAIGEGDLGQPIASSSSDEIGFLADTLETMRRHLRSRDERMQMMLAGIAHEVRNPLAGMELFAGLLREELTGPGDGEKLTHLGRIDRELGHLKTIVSDFLDYARRPRLETRPADAVELLREVRQILAAEAGPKVRLAVDAPEASPLECDPAQLHRALLNLGKNALQALPEEGGEVTLGCAPGAGGVRIWVKDTGRGVAPEHREQLFVPFFTTREQGTGLGLAFVAEIVREHGGEVTVDSEPGRGATFTMTLPTQPPVQAGNKQALA